MNLEERLNAAVARLQDQARALADLARLRMRFDSAKDAKTLKLFDGVSEIPISAATAESLWPAVDKAITELESKAAAKAEALLQDAEPDEPQPQPANP